MSGDQPDNVQKSRVTLVSPVIVLILDAHIDAAQLVETTLLDVGDDRFRVEWVTTLERALERLARGDIDAVLANMNLPDRAGPEVFEQLCLAAPDALVLPLPETAAGSPRAQADGVDSTESVMNMNWLPGALDYVARRKTTEAAWRVADEALFEEKERARVTLGSIGDAVLVTDILGNVTYLNQVAENLTGWSVSRALGQPLSAVFNITDSETGKPARNPALHAMVENTTVGLAANCVLHRLDGTEAGIEDSAAPIHDRHGQVTGAVIVFRDVNQSHAMTRKMAWLACHDSLTGLASRVLLEERFSQVISLAHRHATKAAMLFIDLDNFKQINDDFGHRVGDLVLQTAAGYLLGGVRDADTVCRHGGDEFVVLLADVADPAAAEQAATKLLALFADPLDVCGNKVKVAMSIGISMYPDDGDDMYSLVENADIAMYQAKENREKACGFLAAGGKVRAVDVSPGTC